jgi:hypothetical protein
MNKSKFDKYMAMKKASFFAPKGHYVIDEFFEDFLRDKPTKSQFREMVVKAVGSEDFMYAIWTVRA